LTSAANGTPSLSTSVALNRRALISSLISRASGLAVANGSFRALTGVTPHQYLIALRLRRAATALRTTSKPVAAIAFELGFGDLSTFNARFRSAFGASPQRFRRRPMVPQRRSERAPE
jgi:methylphosphotriester-DNA--protein-cysteine methyltransferase